MPRTKGAKNREVMSPAVHTSSLSLADSQRYAQLSRAIRTLLDYWCREDMVAEEVDLMLTKIEKAWRGIPQQCRCSPPGSGHTCCTGHCLP